MEGGNKVETKQSQADNDRRKRGNDIAELRDRCVDKGSVRETTKDR